MASGEAVGGFLLDVASVLHSLSVALEMERDRVRKVIRPGEHSWLGTGPVPCELSLPCEGPKFVLSSGDARNSWIAVWRWADTNVLVGRWTWLSYI